MSGIQYKCPGCAAPIEYSATQGKMVCAFCRSQFTVAEVEKFNREHFGVEAPVSASVGSANSASTPGSVSGNVTGDGYSSVPAEEIYEGGETGSHRDFTSDELSGMSELECNSCGAVIVADPTTISTRCGFCDNTFVATGRIRVTRVPDFIIPFSVDKKGMLAAFQEATKGKFLLPPKFRNEHILAEATGTYLPFWFHDRAIEGNFYYSATRQRTWSDSENTYTETEQYEVERYCKAEFRGIPVCGTTKLDPKRAEGAEPFDLADSEVFSAAYLSGYAASFYDIDAEQTIDRADRRVVESAKEMTRATLKSYDTLQLTNQSVELERKGLWYALLPMWLIIIEYAGEKYPFAVNGQTGEVVGSFPISKGRLWAVRLGFMAAFILPILLVTWVILASVA
ncbi:MAG: hypothetical protein Q4C87_11870 [Actinomycetaceae bacterium]|nr:hypothetical protein [Actinomycetaceae bacterium]